VNEMQLKKAKRKAIAEMHAKAQNVPDVADSSSYCVSPVSPVSEDADESGPQHNHNTNCEEQAQTRSHGQEELREQSEYQGEPTPLYLSFLIRPKAKVAAHQKQSECKHTSNTRCRVGSVESVLSMVHQFVL